MKLLCLVSNSIAYKPIGECVILFLISSEAHKRPKQGLHYIVLDRGAF